MPSGKKYTEKNRWDWADRGLYCEWFDGWKCFLIENGYAFDQPELDDEGNVISEVTFFPGKKAYIINVDETQVPIDGKSRATNHVSCRVMICSELPRPGRPATKTAGHCTFILTINAEGECGPPFFIFDTSSKIEGNRKVRPEALAHLPYVKATFGCDTATEFSSEFAVTENGSMDKTL